MLIFSCNEKSDLGFNILPEEDIINAQIIDTFSISCYTMEMDTLLTKGVSQLIAGDFDDPIFGNTKAGFATQMTLSEYPSFTAADVADSIVLELPYSSKKFNYYGDLSSTLDIKVYKISKILSPDSNYYHTHSPESIHSGEIMGSKIFTPNPDDSLLIIKLEQQYATSFLTADAEIYNSVDNFRNFFRGIYVSIEKTSGLGSLLKFEIAQGFKIKIYYHKESAPETQLTYSFTGNSTSTVRFNMFSHDYTSASFNTLINDTISVQDSVSYIQSAGGLRTKIKMPYITELNKLGPINIYKAELVVKAESDFFSQENLYPAISELVLTGISPVREYYLIQEYYGQSSYTGVQYTNNEYRFNIASYIRNILDGNIQNYGLYLFTYDESSNFNRTVITSGKHSNRMKLIVTYTKL